MKNLIILLLSYPGYAEKRRQRAALKGSVVSSNKQRKKIKYKTIRVRYLVITVVIFLNTNVE
jgi:hypothetical protein